MLDKQEKKSDSFLTIDHGQIKSLRDIALEAIKEAIVSGRFKPGDHLKERELSEMMGISTTPIKEALRILGNEGLVRTIPRKGTFVSELVNTSIEEILMLKAYLEGLCARLAAMKATDHELELLEEQVKKMESLLKSNNIEKLAEENTAFHVLIRQISKNPMIIKILENVSTFDKAFRKRALKYQIEAHEGLNEHKGIFEAIKSKNPDLAEFRMKKHILRTLDNVLRHLDKHDKE
ncbi:DNA-binding GntR family transcriptional regulator [Caldalkalibacillus uzonensis]|uniref:DNA-binding GntR family transcriptional regulator n=1 Tax=Caldalkalibacillus uzonensis TaxID=353224 RepID=A0ABU0CPT7_9BACI|nr:GntR family transcriptional regulator [Caldalkalibacillus uzonensis]MDQ0338103.1 DNA-binding GntR family transcriptional regulator [Caldalkalibacillus uzonensis]